MNLFHGWLDGIEAHRHRSRLPGQAEIASFSWR